MERAVKGLVDGRYQWVVFTSTNAVKAVWEKFAEFGLDARAFSGVKIACVGTATAECKAAGGGGACGGAGCATLTAQRRSLRCCCACARP